MSFDVMEIYQMESKSKNCIGTKVYSFFLYHDKSRELSGKK